MPLTKEQEKAKELIELFKPHADWNNEYGSTEEKANIKHAKSCAIICVEQIIDGIHGVNEELELTSNVDISSHLTYYEEVLEQIKNS